MADVCEDYDYDPAESPGPRSPLSRVLADFEAYSSRELPRLVEANLQAMVNAEIAPLEESLRAMLVDIVRRCQSTVAQNYDRIRSASAADNDAPPVETSPTALWSPIEDVTASGLLTSFEPSNVSGRPMQHTDHTPSLFFEEPPFVGAEAAALGLNDPFFSTIGSHDSGYGSFFSLPQGPHTNTEPSSKEYSEDQGFVEEYDVRQ